MNRRKYGEKSPAQAFPVRGEGRRPSQQVVGKKLRATKPRSRSLARRCCLEVTEGRTRGESSLDLDLRRLELGSSLVPEHLPMREGSPSFPR